MRPSLGRECSLTGLRPRFAAAMDGTMKRLESVLIADGDIGIRSQYRLALGAVANTIHESDDGAEALGKAICHRPDLVVASAQLRRIDGLSLCRLLRDDPTTRHVSIIVVTAASNVDELSRAQGAGADRVLREPCGPERLLEAALDLSTAAEPAAESMPSVAIGPRPVACPACHAALIYEGSHVGGVKREREQWDEMRCPKCGLYEYRHRTRKLKPIDRMAG